MSHSMSDDGLLCPICVIEFPSKADFDIHKFSEEHKKKWLNRQYRINRKKFVTDQNGIFIESTSDNDELVHHDLALSTIEIRTGAELYIFVITIVHKGDKNDEYLLRDISILHEMQIIESKTKISISDKFQIQKGEKIVCLKKGDRYEVPVTIYPGSRMRTLLVPVIFLLQKVKNKDETFYMGRDIVIKGDEYEVRNFGAFVPGFYPTILNDELPKNLPLNHCDVPSWFQQIAFNNHPKEIHKRMKIGPKLTNHNHLNFFKTLLWLEELQLQLDIQFYSKQNVHLRKVPPAEYSAASCLELIEEGLAENRPCVMERDEVFVCRSIEVVPSGIHIQWYQGIVHKVTNSSLYLAFEQGEFMSRFHEDTNFDVEFIICRHPLKVSHRALHLCKDESLSNFLFPPLPRGVSPLLPEITPYNLKLSDNLEQLQAVKHIVAKSSIPAPYLVFGPPGTGKTVTIVEAIKQVLYHDQKSHVLACAPSNSAADVIAERLLENLDETHVLRLYSKSRSRYLGRNSSDKLLQASNYRSDQVYFPPLDKLLSKRVVVCTFITAARIASACVPDGHFSHVILDEVGHAMEPEALVAFAGILSNKGQLVLAGDPHQLGPVVRNRQASGKGRIFPDMGLDTSYLERLMSLKIYQQGSDGKFNPRLVTKLLNNYRSHGAILKVPNDLFYNSELRVVGNAAQVSCMCNEPILPKKNFPLIFHATKGQDMMETRSPSFHNPQEVEVVAKYVSDLLGKKSKKVQPSEIGIITPYRLQVDKLRSRFRSQFSHCYKQLKIGSVEDFQGEERKVILISTVRASKTHLAKDEIFKLGFLRNPKRFNVAVTRAQSLIIIVGCPGVLQLDKNWLRIIEHIKEGGGYVGAEVPPPVEDIDSIIYNMEKLDICPSFKEISQTQIVEVPAFGEY